MNCKWTTRELIPRTSHYSLSQRAPSIARVTRHENEYVCAHAVHGRLWRIARERGRHWNEDAEELNFDAYRLSVQRNIETEQKIQRKERALVPWGTTIHVHEPWERGPGRPENECVWKSECRFGTPWARTTKSKTQNEMQYETEKHIAFCKIHVKMRKLHGRVRRTRIEDAVYVHKNYIHIYIWIQ